MGLNILAADHQHFCFCPASPTATEENPVCQEDSPESIHMTIAHNRVLHSCIYSMKGSTNQTTNTSQTLSCGQPCLQQPAQGPKLTFLYRRQVATENFFSVAK